MICSFCGHSMCNKNRLYPKLKTEVQKLIMEGVDIFYSGGYGDFDILALRVVGELKLDFPHIQNYIIIPYRDDKFIAKYNYYLEMYSCETLYPFEEKVLPRYAIIKRNQWMVKNCDYLIAHSVSGGSGSGQTLEYAEKQKKKIIYIQ